MYVQRKSKDYVTLRYVTDSIHPETGMYKFVKTCRKLCNPATHSYKRHVSFHFLWSMHTKFDSSLHPPDLTFDPNLIQGQIYTLQKNHPILHGPPLQKNHFRHNNNYHTHRTRLRFLKDLCNNIHAKIFVTKKTKKQFFFALAGLEGHPICIK